MKKILALTLMLSSLLIAGNTYFIETLNTKRGMYAKIVNETGDELVCYIDDYEVIVDPYSESLWYRVDSRFEWGCE